MRFMVLLGVMIVPTFAVANPPVASYIFPAGGQRGAKVNVRVGGLFLHQKCNIEILGSGIQAPAHLLKTRTTWFEGPLLPLPDSQRQEDYPKDMAGTFAIAPDAATGVRYWRLWTSQGATPSMKFVVGELPEIVEEEIDGDPLPVNVTLPVTINGRVFPREDIDVYAIQAKKGQSIHCEVNAARLGSPLDARLEVRDAQGRRVAESDAPTGHDPSLTFVATADGVYHVRIDDVRTLGGQAYVYRLTVTADPYVARVFPLGGRRGSTVQLETQGQAVPHQFSVAIPKDAPAEYAHAIKIGKKTCGNVILDTDDHPEFIAPRDIGKTISLPAVLNGRIHVPGQVDSWKWTGTKGETWEFELRAARLGSTLDGIVTVCDSEGKTLARAEATAADCSVRVTVPADGVYTVQVQDRFVSRGGPASSYRLRIVPPASPDFSLTLPADVVTVPRKGTAKLKIAIARLGGFKDFIELEARGLPAGVSMAKATANDKQTAIDLVFTADEAAKIDVARVTIVGKAAPAPVKKGAKTPVTEINPISRVAAVAAVRGMPEQSNVLLAVALPTPFVIKGEYDMGFAPRGGIHKRKYKIERNGYDGPIEVSLTDRQARHLQGVEGPTIVVPAGASEFTYSAYLPPWMETGRTCRVCVMGVGVVKEPDGSEHRVSFSSVNQNEQLVAVVGPGKLAMEAERTSFTAIPGQKFVVAVKVKRGQGLEGPVELELVVPEHQRGIRAEKVTIGAKEDAGRLIVACADQVTGPFNMPMIVRATLRQAGEPVVAEVKLDVQP